MVFFSHIQEHWNYFGADENLGPVAVSIRREKPEEIKENGPQYNYRIIFRTSEVSSSGVIVKEPRSEQAKPGAMCGVYVLCSIDNRFLYHPGTSWQNCATCLSGTEYM